MSSVSAPRATAAVGLWLLLAGCGPAASLPAGQVMADYPSYESAEALSDAADLVVVGTVVGNREGTSLPLDDGGDDPELNPRAGVQGQIDDRERQASAIPVTVSTVRVDEVVVGTAETGGAIEVSQVRGEPGSPMGDGPVLLFLSGEDATFHIVGGAQGLWVEDDGAFRALAPDRTDLMLTVAEVATLSQADHEAPS